MTNFSKVPSHVWTHGTPHLRAKLGTLNRALLGALGRPSQFSVAKSMLPTNAAYLVRKLNVTPRHLPKNRGGKYTGNYKTIQEMLKNGTLLQKRAKLNSVKRQMKFNANMLPFVLKEMFNKKLLKKKPRSVRVFPQSFFTRR